MIKTRGVIYFNSGTKCILRLVVSIHSLIKYYNGPITIFTDGDESTVLLNNIFNDPKTNKIYIKQIHFPDYLEGKNSVYLKKASLNDYTDYDLNVFIDADTIVRSNIDQLFELTNEYDFVVPQFCNWTTNTRAIVKRINSWSLQYPELINGALNFGKAVNCGVFAFKKDTEFVKNWCDSIIPGRNNFIPDETGMQIILQKYKHFVCDQKFNVSCKYSDPYDQNTAIIHFHGRKHCRLDDNGKLLYGGELWVNEYNEILSENFVNVEKFNLESKDNMIRKWKNFKPIKKITDKRITIVTAVNPPYLEKLRTVLPTWQLKPQFKNKPLIVFYNGFESINNKIEELEWIKDYFNDVRFINWDLPNAESTREMMLSSFILGVKDHVKTPYLVKIDGDAYFSDKQDVFLDHHFEYDLAGHKWKYTKPGKWIAELDDWADSIDLDGDIYLSDEQREEAILSRRYGHRRIASWICMHRTDLVTESATYVGDRLPIPSHDTFIWYFCNRMPDRRWCWHNYKKCGAGNQTDLNKLKEIVNDIKIKYDL